MANVWFNFCCATCKCDVSMFRISFFHLLVARWVHIRPWRTYGSISAVQLANVKFLCLEYPFFICWWIVGLIFAHGERMVQVLLRTLQMWSSRFRTSFYVCHAWYFTRWWKSTMEVCNRQPLADDKGVHREVESEGSLRQSSAPRNTNHIRHIHWDEAA